MTRRLCIAALALAAAGCPGASPRSERPSVVLVLIDQLRADRLGIHGSTDELTPFLDELATTGFYFHNARAAAPWTYPSTVSLHTGLYPQGHRAGRLRDHWIRKLPSEVTTLAEYLRARGYGTAGFIANPYLKPESGFSQGFEHYEHDFVKAWAIDPANSHDQWWLPSSYANSLNASVLDYLRSRPRRPLFLYIHYIDVHGPWDRAPFLEEPCQPDWDCTHESRALYPRAIRYVDRQIRELYHQLDGIFEGQFLFVVTSDHGRALLPTDTSNPLKVEKGSLHDFNLRVPLLLARTRAFEYQGSARANVSLVDVFPTLASLLFPESELALKLDGVSLVRLLEGRETQGRTLFAENGPATLQVARASIRDSLKFMQVTAPTRARFEYDLLRDPQELAPQLRSLSAAQTQRLQELKQAFEIMSKKAPADQPARLTGDTIEKLEALGYTEN